MKLPLSHREALNRKATVIADADDNPICRFMEHDEERAAEICRRVNLHDAVVKSLDALKSAVELMPRGSMDADEEWGNRDGAACAVAEVVLKAAKGES